MFKAIIEIHELLLYANLWNSMSWTLVSFMLWHISCQQLQERPDQDNINNYGLCLDCGVLYFKSDKFDVKP